jgi:hypothetical protein
MIGRALQHCMARRSVFFGAPAPKNLHLKPFAQSPIGEVERRAFS